MRGLSNQWLLWDTEHVTGSRRCLIPPVVTAAFDRPKPASR